MRRKELANDSDLGQKPRGKLLSLRRLRARFCWPLDLVDVSHPPGVEGDIVSSHETGEYLLERKVTRKLTMYQRLPICP